MIVIGTTVGAFYRSLAEELQRYLEKLSGAHLDIVSARQLRDLGEHEPAILLGGPEANEIVRELEKQGAVSFAGLQPDGFVLRTVRHAGRRMLVVGGNTEAATMYAVYELLERQGIVFLLTKDIIPEPRQELEWPELDVRADTRFQRRGLFISNLFPNRSIWSLEDCRAYIDQMAKLKFNYLQFFWFPYEPWLTYEYQGEKKLIGDVAFKEGGYTIQQRFGSHRLEDVVIGREHFDRFGRKWMAPPELQEADTPEEAVAAAQDLLRGIITYAKSKKIKTWLAIDIASLPPNLARSCRRIGWLPFHPLCGTFVCPTDPVLHEINEIRLRALVDTYPEAEGYFLYMPEFVPICYHDSDRELLEAGRAQYYEAIEDLAGPWWGVYSSHYRVDSMETLIDSCIGSIHLIEKMLEARDRIDPDIKVGVGGFGRGFLLPVLDKLFPRDVSFTDMESSGVWTPDGVPMTVFGGMGERERTVIPRGDDDGAMLGMQFNADLYYRDRVLEGSLENGAAGFAIQMNRARGTEQNTKYFAVGAWRPELEPDEFYGDYVKRIFGDTAHETMLRAYRALAQNEGYLKWRGRRNFPICGDLPIEVAIIGRYAKQVNPYDGPKFAEWPKALRDFENRVRWFGRSTELLEQALKYMEAAEPDVSAHGRSELAYLLNRTTAYILHLETLIQLGRAHLRLDEAFRMYARGSGRKEFALALDESVEMFERAHETSRKCATTWSEVVDDLSDLAVLHRINGFMVAGTELIVRFMRNIANFHHGRPYLEPVPFDLLFSPWPVFEETDMGRFQPESAAT